MKLIELWDQIEIRYILITGLRLTPDIAVFLRNAFGDSNCVLLRFQEGENQLLIVGSNGKKVTLYKQEWTLEDVDN